MFKRFQTGSNELSTDNLNKEILVIWGYIYESDIYKYKYTRKSIFKLNEEYAIKSYTLLDTFYSDKTNNIRLYLTCSNYKIRAIATPGTYYSGFISKIYQYQGTGTPTEFIAEESTERDYYTKLETNNLLDKKQNKLTAGENIKIDEKTNTISATGGSGESLWLIDPNSPNIIQPKEKRIITSNNTRIVYIADPTQPQDAVNLRTLNKNIPDLTDYYKKEEVDKELEDKIDKTQFQYAFVLNTFGTEIANLETSDKTIAGAINELIKKIKDLKIGKWKEVGIKQDNKTINYNFIKNKRYRIYYNFELTDSNINNFSWICKEFIHNGNNNQVLENFLYSDNSNTFLQLNINSIFMNTIPISKKVGQLLKLEEEITENTYEITSNTLNITKSEKIDITKPLKINSKTLNIKELAENTFDIELKNTPTPSIPQWKDVAFNISTTGIKNQEIRYDCKENKLYRIWFNLNPRQQKIILPDIYTFTEFVYSLGSGIPQTVTVYSTYIKEGGRLQLLCSRNENIDVFKWEDMNISGGNLWKLQELQE
ncbi:hypothetical protein [Spiroplasma endosymbiont of Dactylopius coccus]